VRASSRILLIYGISTAVNHGVVFVQLAFYARWLSPGEYAAYGLVTTLAALVGAVLTFGLVPAYFRFVREGSDVVATTVFVCVGVVAGVAVLAMLWLRVWVAPLVFGDQAGDHVFTLMLVDFLFETVTIVPLTRLRAEEAPSQYLAVIGAKQLTTILMAGALVQVAARGLEGAMEALVIGAGSGLVVALCLAPLSSRTVDVRLLRRMLRFGMPLQPGLVFNWALTYVDRYLLAAMASFLVLAPYTAVSSLVNGVNGVASSAFSLLWPPIMYRIADSASAPAVFGRVATAFIGAFLWLNLALALNAHQLLQIYSPRYAGAASYLPLMALAYAAYCPFIFTNSAFQLAGRTRLVPILILAGTVFNVVANLILIPRFGGPGAAFASAIGYVALTVTSVALAQRVYRIDYDYRMLALLTLGAVSLVSIHTVVPSSGIALGFTLLAGAAVTVNARRALLAARTAVGG
jgi:O-antigen/teichoic acid export membrane protein